MGSAKVVVGVANDPRSKDALKWALKNLVKSNDVITLLHISRPVRTIPTPTGKKVAIEEVSVEIVAAYLRDMQSKINEFLLAYKRMCDAYKVEVECVIVENDSIQKGLLDYVSNYRIRKLVLGASRLKAVTWRLMHPGLSLRVLKEAPPFCTVLSISKHKPHLVKYSKSHSMEIEAGRTSSKSSNPLVATSLHHHSLGSSLQGELGAHNEVRLCEKATGKPSKTWDGDSSPGYLQKRHTYSSINQYGTSSLTLAISTDVNFPEANQSVLSSSEISGLQDEGQKGGERPLSEQRVELHNDKESQSSPCSSSLGATPMDKQLWDGSDVMLSQMVHGNCFDCNQGHSLHELKASEKFMIETTGHRSDKVLNYISNSSQKELNEKISFRYEVAGSKELASKAAVLSSESPFLKEKRIPSQLSPESYEEKIEMLKEQLEQALRLAEEAQQDAEIQSLLRIRAERAAIWAAEKAEEYSLKQSEEAKRRDEALKAAEVAKAQATEEARRLDKALADVQLARHLVRIEAQRRKAAERRSSKETEARKTALEALQLAQQKFREYDYEDIKAATNNFSESLKLGEGGYGSVYKGKLHHMAVAIKVLKEDGYQGSREFQREVELLCRIHHPHMVLLLGCCPEKGCLVYEYMANGSLEDRLLCKGNTPPLHWSTRFRIVAEVATALHYLHSSRPDPVVHRDLKPANILLDQNLVSKLSDVGLARLVPGRLSDSSSRSFRPDTVPMGTFSYIDPEYQRTGVFGPKSDIYALGIVILQILTGKPPVGVYELVEEALSSERLHEVLDESAGEWPYLESKELSSLALDCAEMQRKHRPDLEKDVLPTLDKIRSFAEDFPVHQAVPPTIPQDEEIAVPSMFMCPILQEIMDDPVTAADGCTYDYKAIKEWFEEHDTSPSTNLKLKHKLLTPNYALRTLIQEWRAKTVS